MIAMKMKCDSCGYTGEKINFMKLETREGALVYVDLCPECGAAGAFSAFDDESVEVHEQARARVERIFEEHRQAVKNYDMPEGTLLTDEELKALDKDG